MIEILEQINVKTSQEILVIGYGDGDVLTFIQERRPKKCVLLEKDALALRKASAWTNEHSNWTLVHSNWETTLPNLGVFDIIFFNDD